VRGVVFVFALASPPGFEPGFSGAICDTPITRHEAEDKFCVSVVRFHWTLLDFQM